MNQSNGHPLTGQFWGSSWESGEQQPSFVTLRLMDSQMMLHAVTVLAWLSFVSNLEEIRALKKKELVKFLFYLSVDPELHADFHLERPEEKRQNKSPQSRVF